MTEEEKIRLVGLITRKRPAKNGMELHFLRVLDESARPASETEHEWFHFYGLDAGIFESLRRSGSYFRTVADAETRLSEVRAAFNDEHERISNVFEKSYDELHDYYLARNEGAEVDPDGVGEIFGDMDFQVKSLGEDRVSLQRKLD